MSFVLSPLMTRHAVMVAPTTTVQEATRLMLKHKVTGLPGVADGRMVGIITESDIFRLVVKTWDTETLPALDYACAQHFRVPAVQA